MRFPDAIWDALKQPGSSPAARRALLVLVDHVLPVAVGALMTWLLWRLDISRCRGLETWDPAAHLTAALSVHNAPSISWLFTTSYPPLTYFWSNLLFLFMEPGRQAAELSVALLLIPFAWASYTLGRIYGGRPAAVVCLVMPFTRWEFINLCQNYLLDLPLITLVTLSLLALHRAGSFQRRRPAIILGLTLGAGMLVKYNFFFFCAPVLAAGALLIIRRAGGLRLFWATLALVGGLAFLYTRSATFSLFMMERRWPLVLLLCATPALLFYLPAVLLGRSRALPWLLRAPEQYGRVRNWLLTMTLCMAPALPWYIFNLDHMFRMLDKNRGLGQVRLDHALLCTSSLNMPWDLALPMALAGLALVWWSPLRRELGCIAAGGLVTFLFMFNATDCNARVFLGIMPFVLVLGTWWLRLLGRLGWLVAALLLIFQVHAVQNDPARWPRYLYINPHLAGGSSNDAMRKEIAEDRRRCQLDRALTAFAAELNTLAHNPRRLTCIYWDDAQARASIDCQDLAVKMGLTQDQAPAIFVSLEKERDPPWLPAPEEREHLVVIHIAGRDDPLEKIQDRFTMLSGIELTYLRFRPLHGTLGVHLWRAGKVPGPGAARERR